MSDPVQTMSLTVDDAIPLGLAMLAGLVIWGSGGRLLRPGFAAAGFALGGALGWVVGMLLPDASAIPVWSVSLVTALLLGALGALATRVLVSIGLALMLALAIPWAIATTAALRPAWFGLPATAAEAAAPSPVAAEPVGPIGPERDELDAWVESLEQPPGGPVDHDQAAVRPPEPAGQDTTVAGDGQPPLPESIALLGDELGLDREHAQETVDKANRLIAGLVEGANGRWGRTPAALQPTLVAAAIVATICGIVVGTLAHGFSATVVTAFAGSLLWLGCGGALVSRAGLGDGPWFPDGPTAWLAWWLSAAVIGLAIQWTLRPKRADKPG
jgi:hypothetical protein